ncbi:MAG: hypothetical protein D6718_00655 [Acidobacteria bacterium]|nr:MAG: hypothetical protein D6718_00655 [Acidobacteriota bacterium]
MTGPATWPRRLSEIPALVLAGGAGTRLRPAVPDRPKALAEIAGRPFLEHLLERLAAEGIVRAILCTGVMGDQVARWAARYSGPVELALSHESEPAGTGGAVALARRRFGLERTLVLNGDTYFEAPLAPLLAAASAAGAPGALLAVRVPDTGRYGALETDAAGRVLRFVEKGQRGPGLISAGAALLGPEILAAIPDDRPVSLEDEVLAAWAGRGLVAAVGEGRFVDIGTPESYRAAEEMFAGTGGVR